MSEPAIGSKVAEGGLPYGVFSRPGERRRVGVRVVDTVLDLAAVARTVHVPRPRPGPIPAAPGRAPAQSST